MRLLHVGDCHVHQGPNFDDTEQALQQVSRIARERAVDLVLIPGDVFDQKSQPAERTLFGEFLRSLDCPCVICKGNHDAPGDLIVFNGYSGVQVFERPEVIPFSEIDLMVLPWPERAHLAALGLTGEGGLQAAQLVLADLIRTMAATRPQPDKPLVIMGHISVCGAISSSGQPMVGREIQVVLQDLVDTGAWYVGLSHIHKPQQLAPAVRYAGSLTVQDFGEEGEEKGVELIEIVPGQEARGETILITGRRWVTIKAAIVETCPGTFIKTEFHGNPDGSAFSGPELAGANVRYVYECEEAEASRFDHGEIERRFASAYSLKIVPNITRSQRIRSQEVAEAKTTREKLIAWGAATNTEIKPGVLSKLEQIEGGRP